MAVYTIHFLLTLNAVKMILMVLTAFFLTPACQNNLVVKELTLYVVTGLADNVISIFQPAPQALVVF